MNVTTALQKIVARASNRVFVGLPLCVSLHPTLESKCTVWLRCGLAGRNEQFLEMAVRFTIDIMKDQVVMNFIPYSLTK